MKKRLAVILSHPIQYYSPLFKQLHLRGNIDVKVFYTLGETSAEKRFDQGFGRQIEWDIPLLEGYDYEMLRNVSKHPGAQDFNGIVNPDIIESIGKFQPNAVLVFGWAFKSHLKAIRYFSGRLPVWFRGDSTLLDEQGGIKTLARYLFLRWVYKHVDKALYVGKNNYDYYIKFGMKPAQLIWASHAVENERFIRDDVAHSRKANKIRSELGLQQDDFVFLFAGKFEPKKDPVLLLNAFLASGFDSGTHLILTGNGVLENQLKLLAKGNQHIHFLDFQNQQAMPALYRVADIFVLPSGGPGETWGLAVNEAMACSRPVIVSDKCGCAPNLVSNAENGFVFSAGDVEDLKRKMGFMRQNKHLLPAMGKASLQKVSGYSFESICDALEDTVTAL